MNEIIRGRLEPAAVERAIAELAATFGNRLVTSQACASSTGTPQPGSLPSHPTRSSFHSRPTMCSEPSASAPAIARLSFHSGPERLSRVSVNAPLGGVSLDFKDMNRVVAVHVEDFDCVVEPGSHTQAAQRTPPGSGSVLSRRSWRRRFAGWNGLDARLGNDRGSLRNHERQCPGAEGRARQWRAHVHVATGAKVVGRLRPHPPHRRRGGHARRHHRIDVEASGHSGSDFFRRLPVPLDQGGLLRRHSRDPGRHPRCARRASRRGAGPLLQRLFKARHA